MRMRERRQIWFITRTLKKYCDRYAARGSPELSAKFARAAALLIDILEEGRNETKNGGETK